RGDVWGGPLWGGGRGGGGRWGWRGGRRHGQLQGWQMLLKVFGGDFVERAGRHAGSRDSEFLGFRQDIFALDAMFLGYVVNPNGHNNQSPTQVARTPSC